MILVINLCDCFFFFVIPFMQLHKLCRRWEVACMAGAKRGGGGREREKRES